jgi:hypothetical protein
MFSQSLQSIFPCDLGTHELGMHVSQLERFLLKSFVLIFLCKVWLGLGYVNGNQNWFLMIMSLNKEHLSLALNLDV